MKRFIPAALAALSLAVGAATVAPSPAQAGQTSCYFEAAHEPHAGGRWFGCSVRNFTTSGGDRVTEVRWHDGIMTRYVFWRNGTAEIFSGGTRYYGTWENVGRAGVKIFHGTGARTGIMDITVH